MKKLSLFFVCLLWICVCSNVYSETIWEDFSRWSVGVGIGLNAFDGDIEINEKDNSVFKFPSVEAYVEYGMSPIFSLGLGYNYHRIGADNNKFRFESHTHFVYPFLGINFVNLFIRENKSKWGIWGTVGGGWANYTSTKDKNYGTKENPDYQHYAGGDKSMNAFIIPVSTLIEYNITDRLAINARYQYTGFLVPIM